MPHVSEERERFFYLFLDVGSLSEPFGRVLNRLVPEALLRRRALVRARAELAAEFDMHAGRARCDLTQRLDEGLVILDDVEVVKYVGRPKGKK